MVLLMAPYVNTHSTISEMCAISLKGVPKRQLSLHPLPPTIARVSKNRTWHPTNLLHTPAQPAMRGITIHARMPEHGHGDLWRGHRQGKAEHGVAQFAGVPLVAMRYQQQLRMGQVSKLLERFEMVADVAQSLLQVLRFSKFSRVPWLSRH